MTCWYLYTFWLTLVFSFLVVGCKGTVNQYILALLESLVTYLHYNSCFILSIHTTGQQKYLLLI